MQKTDESWTVTSDYHKLNQVMTATAAGKIDVVSLPEQISAMSHFLVCSY